MVHYIVEAIVVGLMTMILGTILSVLSMYVSQRNFSIGEVNFWTSLLVVNFILGFLIHVICEWTGINKWYCSKGFACQR